MTETETKTKTETVTKIKTETETKIEPMAETETDTETETETKTEIETKTGTTGETETREGEGAVTSPRSSQTLHSLVCPLAAAHFYNTVATFRSLDSRGTHLTNQPITKIFPESQTIQ